jgi:translation initiation factor 2B subunit (eIF-2B alpha/beta/delta family)
VARHVRHRPPARELRALARDRTSSANELAGKAIAVLERWSRGLGARPGAAVRAETAEVGRGLRSLQPAMAIFRTWADSWAREVVSRRPTNPRPAIASWVRRRKRELGAEPRALRTRVRMYLPPQSRLLTQSRSSTVAGALLALSPRRRPRQVLALESRPGGEGRRLARELRDGGIPARVVPDAEAARALEEVDLVLVGADSVDPRGNLTHKVGTRRLAAAARRARVPFVVLAGRSKWARAGRPAHLPRSFDRTPAGWITEYWTDRGVWRPPRRRTGPTSGPRRRAA